MTATEALGWYEFIYDDKNADMFFIFFFFLEGDMNEGISDL